MNDFINDLKRKYQAGNICIRFIYINVAVFLATTLFSIALQLFNQNGFFLLRYAELPASISTFLLQPWSLFTYMFMHADLLHILFNMLWLYWFGELFLNRFSSKHFRGVYLLGGVIGGAFYLSAYNLFPYFQSYIGTSMLVGASASVLAIAIAAAMSDPERPMNFLFIGAVRLKYVALIMIAMDLLFITSDNAGGHWAHLGGALAGWLFAWGIRNGKFDATSWINTPLDAISRLFSSSSSSSRTKKPKMTVNFGGRSKDYEYNARKKAEDDEIDRILDKVKQSGYAGLTAQEKQKLFDASKK